MRYLGAAAIGAVLFGAVSIGSPASAFGGFWGAGWNGGGWQADGWHGGWCLRPGSAAGFGLSRGRVADWDCDDFYRHPGHAYAPGVDAPAPKVATTTPRVAGRRVAENVGGAPKVRKCELYHRATPGDRSSCRVSGAMPEDR
jgi:hypothetical protein